MTTIPAIELSRTEPRVPGRRNVLKDDVDWFDELCEVEGIAPAGLFRRMRIAFERDGHPEVELPGDAERFPMRKTVVISDRDWFEQLCNSIGVLPEALFRRMRLAFEATHAFTKTDSP